jgi:hypothetical protein
MENVITRKINTSFFTIIIFGIILTSCHKDNSQDIQVLKTGDLSINMIHYVNGHHLLFDSLAYANSLDQQYMVNDLQYFLSGFILHSTSGKWIEIPGDAAIHYIDAKNSTSLQWLIPKQIPSGYYDSIGFVFGLNEVDNISNRFPDPPERDMFWPEILGGGYHYMKMNLKWKYPGMQETMPFMFHLGIGQMYSGSTANTDSIIGFIQNYFSVKLPVDIKIDHNKPSSVFLEMNVEKWFDGENTFDFSLYPMGIMQSQLGMYRACMNGRTVFSVERVLDPDF